ncbi:hypothetical protein BD560DRAFT_493624 [Blakeslea trispora]|nr:hypothetical protein BD560DRAFT_493624 [Blakeslea trispora]
MRLTHGITSVESSRSNGTYLLISFVSYPLGNASQKKLNEVDFANQDDSDDSESKPTKRSGRRKIKIEYIEDKNRRHITFSKRKAGIMKKAYELSTLTGTQVLLLVVSETGLVYTFTTTKLQPIVTKPEGKNLIQNCLNTPDPAATETNTDLPAEESSSTRLQAPSQPSQPPMESSINPSSVTASSVVNRIPEETKNLSPQTTASHSPMMQPSPNMIRQSNMIPPVSTTGNPPSNNPPPPQNNMPPYVNQSQMPMPSYNQQPRYPNYNNNSLPQPYQPSYNQQPYYQSQQSPYANQGPGLPSLPHSQHQPSNPGGHGYWSYGGDQQGNSGGNATNSGRGSNVKQE